jgi:hypothetical protein
VVSQSTSESDEQEFYLGDPGREIGLGEVNDPATEAEFLNFGGISFDNYKSQV